MGSTAIENLDAAEAADVPEMWTVFDSNARQGPREHFVNAEVSYHLHATKGTPMPRHHAAIFLKDPAFRVLDSRGTRLASLPEIETQAVTMRKLQLADGETVARYDELTDAALLARVAVRPGGSDLAITADRAEMISFLINAPRQAELPRHLRARDTSLAEEVDADEALPDAAAKAMLLRDGSVGARDALAMGG